MSRRRIVESPFSRLALWARRLALFAFVATFLAIIIVRSGLLEIYPAIVTFGGALAFGVVAIAFALASLVVIWRTGLRGLGHAVTALFLSGILLAYPFYLAASAYRLPPVTDITTDPIDPPRFEAIARVRPREANSIIYAGLYAAEQQRHAYPDIEPLALSSDAKAAYDAALSVVTKRKWRVVDAREPQRNREGHIEAVARTPIMGFRDDIVIRVRAAEDGSRVDIRSASRYGRYDFGANASRILALSEEIESIADAADTKRQQQQQKPRTTKAQSPAKR